MIGGSYVAGAEITNLNLIRDLHQQGYGVLVVVNGWNDGDFIKRLSQYEIPYRSIKLGFIYITKPLWTLDSLIHYPKAIFQLQKILKKFNPDFIFHASYRSFLMSYPLIRGYKNIYREHNNPTINNKNYKLYHFLEKRITYFICPSETVKQTLLNFSIPLTKIQVIPSPIDPEFTRFNFRIDDSRREVTNVGIIGQIHSEKGFDFLFNELVKVKNDFKLFIYGNDTNDYAKSLKENLPKEILDKVKWMGYVKNRLEIYQHLDIVIFPSLSESFGRIIIEAGAFGIPTIASDISCFKEIIKHGETGLMFKLTDTSELTSYLEQLLSNDLKRKKMGENARTYVLNNFTSQKCTEKFEVLLKY